MTVLENLKTLDESLHGIDALPALPPILGRNGEYFGHEWSNWRYDTLDHRVDRLLENYGIAGAEILDIGCATGARAAQWAEAGHRVTAVDIVDRSGAIRARNDVLSHRWPGQRTWPPIDFIHADIRVMPVFAGRFDLVHARRVINFMALDDLDGLWGAVRRMVKDDGLVVVSLIAAGLDQDAAISGRSAPQDRLSVSLGPGIHAHHFGEVRSALCDHGFMVVETFSDGQVEAGLMARAIPKSP